MACPLDRQQKRLVRYLMYTLSLRNQKFESSFGFLSQFVICLLTGLRTWRLYLRSWVSLSFAVSLRALWSSTLMPALCLNYATALSITVIYKGHMRYLFLRRILLYMRAMCACSFFDFTIILYVHPHTSCILHLCSHISRILVVHYCKKQSATATARPASKHKKICHKKSS